MLQLLQTDVPRDWEKISIIAGDALHALKCAYFKKKYWQSSKKKHEKVREEEGAATVLEAQVREPPDVSSNWNMKDESRIFVYVKKIIDH